MPPHLQARGFLSKGRWRGQVAGTRAEAPAAHIQQSSWVHSARQAGGWGWGVSWATQPCGVPRLPAAGREHVSSAHLPRRGAPPASRAARRPGARAPAHQLPQLPQLRAAGLPGNTNQTPAFCRPPRAAAAEGGGLGLWARAGGPCDAQRQARSRSRCPCLAQPLVQPVTACRLLCTPPTPSTLRGEARLFLDLWTALCRRLARTESNHQAPRCASL